MEQGNYFNLPDLELAVLKCREEELYHWLRHLNEVVKYISNDYVSKQLDPSDRIEELNRELERAKGEQGLLINKANESLLNEMKGLREALTASQAISTRVDTLDQSLAQLRDRIAGLFTQLTDLSNELTKLKNNTQNTQDTGVRDDS